MVCPQCSDFLRDGSTECRECGWRAYPLVEKGPKPRGEAGTAWSPPTPVYVEEPWRRVPQEPIPEDVHRELQALKAKLATPADRPVLDPDHVARYLAKCEAKKQARREGR